MPSRISALTCTSLAVSASSAVGSITTRTSLPSQKSARGIRRHPQDRQGRCWHKDEYCVPAAEPIGSTIMFKPSVCWLTERTFPDISNSFRRLQQPGRPRLPRLSHILADYSCRPVLLNHLPVCWSVTANENKSFVIHLDSDFATNASLQQAQTKKDKLGY